MKLYLDNCCFNRPFDDQAQIRIRLEAEAKLEIQSRIKRGELLLSWSFMLDFENSRNPDFLKRNEIAGWAAISQDYFTGTENTETLAKEIMLHGIKPKDSVHLACAIETGCDYFLTTDDGILRRKDVVTGIAIMNPMDFIVVLEGQNED